MEEDDLGVVVVVVATAFDDSFVSIDTLGLAKDSNGCRVVLEGPLQIIPIFQD
jgi:hypothetical protein